MSRTRRVLRLIYLWLMTIFYGGSALQTWLIEKYADWPTGGRKGGKRRP